MKETQNNSSNKSPISMKKPAIRGILLGAIVAVVVLLLFGLIGNSWLVGILAGICCFIGVFLCTFGWCYMKSLEKYYKAHPELIPKEEKAEEENSPANKDTTKE